MCTLLSPEACFSPICTKYRLAAGAVGVYSAPPDPLAGLRGPTSKGRRRGEDRRGDKGGGRGKGKGEEGGERERKGRGG